MCEGKFKHGSLFSGIGGFDLAAEWMGWENIFHCEWNEFGKRVLNYYWPNAISYDDITKTDFTIHRGAIDILTGGFPCQPYSVAGKRKGKEDERHLWPQMLRAIREIQPRYVVGENVAGLISWDGGLVFHEVQTDLENEGYEVWPFILPAASVNAPHKRERVWFIAYSIGNGHDRNERTERNNLAGEQPTNTQQTRNKRAGETFGLSIKQPFTNSDSPGVQGKCESKQRKRKPNGLCCQNATPNTGLLGQAKRKQQTARVIECGGWEEFPTQPPICSGDDGISEQLDGITFPKWRAESVKAYGNAIVPQVALQIFKAIQIADRQNREGNF